MKAPEKQPEEDGLPIPLYTVYNIGNSNQGNLLGFVRILQEELIAAKVFPADYDFEAHKELVSMLAGELPIPLPTSPHWKKSLASAQATHCVTVYVHLHSGMLNIINNPERSFRTCFGI